MSTSTEETAPIKDPTLSNAQIEEYLDYYVDLKGPPNYAVLLNGEWGSGKTWFIKAFQDKHKSKHKFLYVTLYGVSSPSEIEDQFFQQLHPILAHKAFTVGAKILRDSLKGALKINLEGLGKASGDLSAELPNVDLKELLKSSENRILIFDDLERCKMKPEQILGYINSFVEHQGLKVIILAHESEIKSSNKFRKTNEKLIGRRFTINAEFQKALSVFLGELDNEKVRTVLNRNGDLIAAIYAKANHNNLRTLRHSIIEYQRLFSILPTKAQEHDDFQKACINTVFGLIIEFKSGNIVPSDLQNLAERRQKISVRKALATSQKTRAEKPADDLLDGQEDSFERALGDSFEPTVPDQYFLYNFFEFGSVPGDILSEAIEGCRFFYNAQTPPWMRLWRIWDLEVDDLETLLGAVHESFSAYQITKPGEIKHIAAILLFFAKKGITKTKISAVKSYVEKVIRHMDRNNLIEILPGGNEFRINDAYAGLGFIDPSSKEFIEVCKTLKQYQDRRISESLKQESLGLTDLMRTNSRKFVNDFTISHSNSPKFYRIPVLRNLSVTAFLDSFIAMPAKNRSDITYVFEQRYQHIGNAPELSQELVWLKQLKSKLGARLKSLRQPTKFHLMHFDEKGITPAIKAINEFQKAKKPGPLV